MSSYVHQRNLRISPTPSNLTKYAQKTLHTKTLLSRGGSGKIFHDTEKNTKNKNYKTNKYYPFSDWDCHTGNPVKRKEMGRPREGFFSDTLPGRVDLDRNSQYAIKKVQIP